MMDRQTHRGGGAFGVSNPALLQYSIHSPCILRVIWDLTEAVRVPHEVLGGARFGMGGFLFLGGGVLTPYHSTVPTPRTRITTARGCN